MFVCLPFDVAYHGEGYKITYVISVWESMGGEGKGIRELVLCHKFETSGLDIWMPQRQSHINIERNLRRAHAKGHFTPQMFESKMLMAAKWQKIHSSSKDTNFRHAP